MRFAAIALTSLAFLSFFALPAGAGPREDAAALSGALPGPFNPWNKTKSNVVISGDEGYAYVYFQKPDKTEIRVVLGAGKITLKRVMEIAAKGLKTAKFIRGTWTSPKSGRKVHVAITYTAGEEKQARGYLRGIQWTSAEKIAGLPKE